MRSALFLIPPRGLEIEEGWVNLHLLLWKHIVAHLVRIDTENEKFDRRSIWKPAWSRFKDKCRTLQVRVQDHRRLAESRGYSKLPDLSKRGSPMAPIASFDEQGRIEWNEEICEKIEQLCREK